MSIVTISGPLCSGKNYYSEKINIDSTIIDIGDIVREITYSETRTFDRSLDSLIIEKLERELKNSLFHGESVIVVGIRQISIIKAVERLANKGENVTHFLLDVDVDVRKKRYVERNAAKDTYLTFEVADQKDNELGLAALIEYLKKQKNTIIVKNQ